MTIDKNENSMQVNNAGIAGAIVDGDALAASGLGKVSFVSMIFFPNVSLDVPNVNKFLEAREWSLLLDAGRCQSRFE